MVLKCFAAALAFGAGAVAQAYTDNKTLEAIKETAKTTGTVSLEKNGSTGYMAGITAAVIIMIM